MTMAGAAGELLSAMQSNTKLTLSCGIPNRMPW
jgi:hypothetical protein